MALKQKYNPITSEFNMVSEGEDVSTKQNVNSGFDELTPLSVTYSTTTRVLSVTGTTGSFTFSVLKDGKYVSYTKTGTVNFPAWTATSGSWYFYFDKDGVAVTSQTKLEDLNNIVFLYKIVVNATKTQDSQVVSEYFIGYKSATSYIDRKYKSAISGTVWYKGLDCFNNATNSGVPATNGSNTVISLSSGKTIDENLEFSYTNSELLEEFNQILGNNVIGSLNSTNSGIFHITYRDANGNVELKQGTRFPFLFNETTNVPQYVSSSTFLPVNVSNNNFFVSFVYSIGNKKRGNGIRVTPAYSQFSSRNDARAITWDDIKTIDSNYDNPNIRPLYKLIYEYRGSYSDLCKYSVLRDVIDLRKSVVSQTTITGGTIQASSVLTSPISPYILSNSQSTFENINNKMVGSFTKPLRISVGDSQSAIPGGGAGNVSVPFTILGFTGINGIPTTAKMYGFEFLINYENTGNWVPAMSFVQYQSAGNSAVSVTGFVDMTNQNFNILYKGLSGTGFANCPYRVKILWSE